MWEGIQAMFALVVIVLVTVVAFVLVDELTELPDLIRSGVRGWAGRRSLAARLAELEGRMTAAERRLARPPG